MIKKIGVVTGGGDCPGLNTVIRAVAKAAANRGWESIGIIGGYQGLLPPGNFRLLDHTAIDGLLVRGGTILGTANRGPYSAKVGHGEERRLPIELLDETNRGMEALGICALVSIGGDGSLSIAQQFHEHGIPIIGVPKTIDNDLAGTLMTFGFDSAVACATDCARPITYDGGESQQSDGPGSHGAICRLDCALRRTGGRRRRDPHSGNTL